MMRPHPLSLLEATLPLAVLAAMNRVDRFECAHHARIWHPGELDAFDRKLRALHVMAACAVGYRLSLLS